MSEISKIEALLLKREIEAMNNEIRRGAGIIMDAFVKYADPRSQPYNTPALSVPDDRQALAELNDYVRKIGTLSTFYCAGYHLAQGRAGTVDPVKPPAWLQELMLERIVPQFLESINDGHNIAEQALHNSQQ